MNIKDFHHSIFVVILMLSFSCLLFLNSGLSYTFAQNENNTGRADTSSNTIGLLPPIMGVKIASPAANEQVSIGQNNDMKVIGTSTDSINTDCQVSVILNDVKPYQNVIPTGPNGENDYSTWSYSLTPEYNATIKEGTNKINSKLSCGNPSNNTNSSSDLATQYNVFFKASTSASKPTSNNNNTISSIPSVDKQPSSNLASVSSPVLASNGSNIAPLITPSHSSADINNNQNSKTTSSISSNTINQSSAPTPLSIKITSHTQNQTVPANKPLKIFGISSDNANSNCAVYADWNDLEPMQKANTSGASGANGVNDYSNWTFTYSSNYHLITEGANELTSKLDCGGSSIKYYTVNVTGISEPLQSPLLNNESNDSSSNNSQLPFSLPVGSANNDNDDNGNDRDSNDGSSDDTQELSDIDNGDDENQGKDKGQKKGLNGESKGKGPKGKNK
ncbi:hypothetical protein BH18THE2_BH18THE2_06590 [soil metagenome]